MAWDLRLSNLTPGPDTYRIDWFGEVGYPGSVRRYSQPSIRVAISPLTNPDVQWPLQTNSKQQQQVWMPIGSLPMLRIGDIWQNGTLIAKPAYQAERFDIDLSKHPATPIKAGVSIGEDHLLPFAEHPFHDQHTHSYCLSVPLEGKRTLIIPGAELIRFYFGSSSKLIHRLFTAPFKEKAFWHEKYFDPATGHLHLKLVERMTRSSVQDLARIALDEHAKEAAAAVYGNCAKATSRQDAAYPYINFPFVGRTTLHAHGVWLSFQGKPQQTFLAFNLCNCLHPFPFKSLTFDSPASEGNSRKAETSQHSPQQRSSRGAHQGPIELDEADPGQKKQHKEIAFGKDFRFPDLLKKPTWQQQVIQLGAEAIYRKLGDGSIEKISFGDPTSSGEARPIDVALGNTTPIPATGDLKLPYFVLHGIRAARANLPELDRHLDSKPLLIEGRSEPVFSLPMLIDEDGVVDTAPMFAEPDGHHRLRRICFVGFYDGDIQKYQFGIIEGSKLGIEEKVLMVDGETDGQEILRSHLNLFY